MVEEQIGRGKLKVPPIMKLKTWNLMKSYNRGEPKVFRIPETLPTRLLQKELVSHPRAAAADPDWASVVRVSHRIFRPKKSLSHEKMGLEMKRSGDDGLTDGRTGEEEERD